MSQSNEREAGRCIIFFLHRISPNAETDRWGLTIDPAEFEQVIQSLLDFGNLLPLSEALERLWQGDASTSTVLTIDDGYRDLVEYAFPNLMRHQAPATVFVPSYYVETGQPFWWEVLRWLDDKPEMLQRLSTRWHWPLSSSPEATVDAWCGHMKYLSLEKREELLEDIDYPFDLPGAMSIAETTGKPDVCSIGCHGHSHTVLSSLSDNQSMAELEYSFLQVCQWDRSAPKVFAYPNGEKGDYRDTDINHLQTVGMCGALTTTPGVNLSDTDSFQLRRIGLEPGKALAQIETILR